MATAPRLARPRPPVAAAAALALAALGTRSVGRAQPGPPCGEAFVAWAAACDAGEAPVEASSCPSGHVTLVVGPGRIAVDVTRRSEGAFAAAGELGLSPIGDFPDWSAVPGADREAFDALVLCARERPEGLVRALAPTPEPPHDAGAGSPDAPAPAVPLLPWRLALGLGVALALLLRRFGGRGLWRRAGPPLALSAATFVGRRLVLPEAYFHQNGHGPEWVAYALGRPSAYGPGYAQAFGWAATRAADPDGAVFVVQGALGALVPAAAFGIARAIGAPRPFAWAAAVAVAASPLLSRIAQTESYFATEGALVVLASAALGLTAGGDAPPRVRLLGAAAAGLVLAQLALVHPVGWLAAALVPSVLLLGPGSVGARAKDAAAASLVIALVVAATAGPSMLDVLSGSLGDAWLGPATASDGRVTPAWVIGALAAAAAAIALGVRRPAVARQALAVAVLAVTAATAWRGNLLGPSAAYVHEAYAWLYLGPVLAGLAALVPQRPTDLGGMLATRRGALGAAGALLVVALCAYGATAERSLATATDTREAALVRIWRDALPDRASIAHLERADRAMLTLPLHRFRVLALDAAAPAPDLAALPGEVFYYRAGPCTTARGRPFCDALEARYVLEPFAVATLPAAPSMTDLPYDRETVDVGLFRVRGRRD